MTKKQFFYLFFWNWGNILHLNIIEYFRKTKFLNLVPFCDIDVKMT